MTCMFDRDDECSSGCLDCVRYQPKECCECEATGKLKLYEDGEYYCPECLAERLIGESDLAQPLADFIDRNYESLLIYLAKA